MRLLAHNLLQCNAKNCTNSFPLSLRVSRFVLGPSFAPISDSFSVKEREIEFNPDFVNRMLDRLDYPAFRQALGEVGSFEGDSHLS